jgi:pyrroloquinoline quinone (PQQ) biosynthesis protein C
MPGCAEGNARPKADRLSSSLAIPWVFAAFYRKTRQLEVLNAELERCVVERTEELAHAKEQLLRMLAFAHREDLQPESSMFPH